MRENFNRFEKLLCRLFRYEPISSGTGVPSIYRWYLFSLGTVRVYLHHFVADESRDPHDHPKFFVSIGLAGAYVEVLGSGDPEWKRPLRIYRAPWVRWFGAEHVHRIMLHPSYPRGAWTLCVTGKKWREWGFFTDAGWVHYLTYTKGWGERYHAWQRGGSA